MIDDKQMKRRDCDFLFSGNTMACKWIDYRSVLVLSSSLEGMSEILSVQRREKDSKTKYFVSCPNVIKFYNSGMGEVDRMDQRTAACCLDRKSSVRFYVGIFYDLMDIASKQTFVLMKASWKRLDQDEYIRLTHSSSENVFKTSSSRPTYSSWSYGFRTSSRRFQDVFNTSSRRLQDIFKTSSRRFQDLLSSLTLLGNTISRRLPGVFKAFLRRTAKTIIYRRFA